MLCTNEDCMVNLSTDLKSCIVSFHSIFMYSSKV